MADNDATSPNSSTAPLARQNGKKMALLGVLGGLLIGGGAGAIFGIPYMQEFKDRMSGQTAVAAASEPEAEPSLGHDDQEHATGLVSEAGPDVAPDGAREHAERRPIKGHPEPIIVPIDGIIVNPSGATRNFLMVGIGLVVADSASVPTVLAKEAVYRDVIITTLGQQPFALLSNPMERDSLRMVILRGIRRQAPSPQIRGLLFSQYVIQ